MNCKPNELAVLVKPPSNMPEMLGRFMTTIRLVDPNAPTETPEGYRFAPTNAPGWWLVEMQNPVNTPPEHNPPLNLRFIVLPDFALRPIRGMPGDDEQPIEQTLTSKKELTA